MLHLISQATITSDSFFNALNHGEPAQTLLFYGEGCYNLQRESIQALGEKHTLLVLAVDLQARGLTTNIAQSITMDEFVQQVFNAPNNASWF